MWGEEQTRFFFELTPDRVLEAAEASGLRCTGRCMSLNSFENRVYDIELELDDESSLASRKRVVAKFYRPGRWSVQQILEEHRFLDDLIEAEIPAVAPLRFPDGKTLHATSSEIQYTLFPKVGGRAPDELSDDQLVRIGRLLGRIHNVGAKRKAEHRLAITPQSYGLANLQFLLEHDWIPMEFRARYEATVRTICAQTQNWLETVPLSGIHRLHGDCHLGNLLWNQEGPFFLDFDDMVIGPAAQDVWLLVPGRDEDSLRQRDVLLQGYEEMRVFDRTSLRWVEALRALRFIHYTAWIARRWKDPAFPAAFPQFGTHRYWQDETADLEEQQRILSASAT